MLGQACHTTCQRRSGEVRRGVVSHCLLAAAKRGGAKVKFRAYLLAPFVLQISQTLVQCYL